MPFGALFTAATGLKAYEEELNDVSNNLANSRTPGFKKGRVDMETLFYIQRSFPQELDTAMAKNDSFFLPPVGIEVGTGVRVAATPHDFSQGSIAVTNKPLDVAIDGEGFFQFRMPDGSLAYGRTGNFQLDREGNLVDPNGHLLEPAIVIPEGTTAVQVNQDGKVSVSINNSVELTEVGQIDLAPFTNSPGLKSIGQNLSVPTPASGEALVGTPSQEGFGNVAQFSLENSNVDVISEMVRTVQVQRVFDTLIQMVQAANGMLTALGQINRG